jgi:GMP synthase - Glutamine amidotransferase domain
MKIHYLQHVPFEGLGFIETWLNENNHEMSSTRFDETDYHFPNSGEIDALIIMGGPMGVYDEHLYSWLYEEKQFIKDCIQADKKILGICLGAQLLSVCLGADVHSAENKEIGWFKVSPTEECKKIDWLYDLFKDEPVVFHWHGDTFEIPLDGSFSFLESNANSNQAFYHNENIIGLQFHVEVTPETTALMLKNGKNELMKSSYTQTETEIQNGLVHVKNCNRIMEVILENWLK